MKVEFDEKKMVCIVTKEADDKKYRRGGWSSAESTFLYDLKNKLNELGLNVIKKRMSADGHLVSEEQQYIRSRNVNKPGAFCIRNLQYLIRDLGEVFNEVKDGDALSLTVEAL